MELSSSEKKWNNSIENERHYWNNTIVKTEIKILDLFTYCQINKIYITNRDALFNPLIGRC